MAPFRKDRRFVPLWLGRAPAAAVIRNTGRLSGSLALRYALMGMWTVYLCVSYTAENK